MISPEAFNKFLADVQIQIELADKLNKAKTEATLKAISDNYRQKVADRISTEIALANECHRVGDDMGLRHHTLLIEVYKSILDQQKT